MTDEKTEDETGTEVATQDTATGLASITDVKVLQAALLQAADEEAPEFGKFLKFDSTFGVFSYTDNGEPMDMDDDTLFVVNPLGMKRQLTCWVDGEAVDKITVPFTEQLPPIESLEEHRDDPEGCEADKECRDGWQESHITPVIDLKTGEQYDFAVNSKSGKRAVGGLKRLMGKEIAQHDITCEQPVFGFTVSSFFMKEYNKTVYYPVFELMSWRNVESDPIVPQTADASDDDEDEAEADEAPAKTKRPARKEAKKPAKRRRRRAAA